ncbi:hypothetical protein TpMuguga_03g02525 [Theileria parva strain Muguga]|uniref:uncharacterized protein n=1 Tax=Theileria parva strain Muguga TaxID=333668 RepID=UPI001C621347|nr:uncharacterized protein TpMuguga_03g02525 [Theileria parva strain Muguga]KAF5153105.1 hypothetical protein TpMuguga_03g02525 [Theileria parva strain Muguga]
MANLYYIPGYKLLLSKISEKKTDLELLSQPFYTVSEIPKFLSNRISQTDTTDVKQHNIYIEEHNTDLEDNSVVEEDINLYNNYKTINIILQFGDTKSLENINCLNEYYKDYIILLAGDPTGCVHILISKQLLLKNNLIQNKYNGKINSDLKLSQGKPFEKDEEGHLEEELTPKSEKVCEVDEMESSSNSEKAEIKNNLLLSERVYSLLNVGIVIVYNKIYLQALEDTKFICCTKCENGIPEVTPNFINYSNNITKLLNCDMKQC